VDNLLQFSWFVKAIHQSRRNPKRGAVSTNFQPKRSQSDPCYPGDGKTGIREPSSDDDKASDLTVDQIKKRLAELDWRLKFLKRSSLAKKL